MLAGRGIARVAIVADPGPRDAAGDGVAELAAEVETSFGAAVVADRALDRATLVVEGVFGGDLDRATGGVLAVQGALRPAEDFHLLHVEQREQRTVDARVVDIINIHADARVESLQCIRLPDSANEHVDAVGGAAALHDIHVRHGALQAIDVARLQVLQRILGERTDRDRDILDGFAAATRGDGHGVERLGAARRRLFVCVGWRGHRISRRGVLREGCSCGQAQRDGQAQGASVERGAHLRIPHWCGHAAPRGRPRQA